jgi:hypothetical protein
MRIKGKSYRPELHYMRGPGPKWREKNGLAAPAPSDRRFDLPYSSWLIPAVTLVLMLAVTALALA